VSAEQTESRGEVGVDRLLTFSDGVFAIAVTLLVLDLRQPVVSHGLLGALLEEWPAYLSYVLSFLVVGIIWAQHHLMFGYIRRTDHLFILINVVSLMWVAVVPFPTALLARYLENPGERQTAVAIYAGFFLVGSLLVNLRWLYASRWGRLLDEGVDGRTVRKLTWNHAVAPAFYGLDFALSFVSAAASITLLVLIGVFYTVSPLLGGRIRRAEDEAGSGQGET
jgi:uncharacterized membrane protein